MPKVDAATLRKLRAYLKATDGSSYPWGNLRGDPKIVDILLPRLEAEEVGGRHHTFPLGEAIDRARNHVGTRSQFKALHYPAWMVLQRFGLRDLVPSKRKPTKPYKCAHCRGTGWLTPTTPCQAEGCR